MILENCLPLQAQLAPPLRLTTTWCPWRRAGSAMAPLEFRLPTSRPPPVNRHWRTVCAAGGRPAGPRTPTPSSTDPWPASSRGSTPTPGLSPKGAGRGSSGATRPSTGRPTRAASRSRSASTGTTRRRDCGRPSSQKTFRKTLLVRYNSKNALWSICYKKSRSWFFKAETFLKITHHYVVKGNWWWFLSKHQLTRFDHLRSSFDHHMLRKQNHNCLRRLHNPIFFA